MENKQFDIKAARENLKLRDKRFAKDLHKKFELAWHDFNAITKMLQDKYNPKRIYQWGSLLNEDNFSDISDIDVAVEGVESVETFFAMYGDAEKLTEFPLHFVEIEKIEPVYADSIREKGKVVYER